MKPKIFLLHGWSVTSTSTYRGLHKALAARGYDLEEVFLGRYVSLEDQVQLRDLSRALDQEFRRLMGRGVWQQPFHVITHSTGALVLRHWLAHHYQGSRTREKPLKGVVFLAGPHFGSRLAHHGRSMLAQVKFLGDTGAELLKTLELGSPDQWDLADSWLKEQTWQDMGIRFFSLTGDRVEKRPFLSRLFAGAFEAGSDMVVRCPAANLNFRRFRLSPDGKVQALGGHQGAWFTALNRYTHSGEKHGIMNSITAGADPDSARFKNLQLILAALSAAEGKQIRRGQQLWQKAHEETRGKVSPHAQLQLRFRDQEGHPIPDYLVRFGYLKGGQDRPTKMVAHTHKHRVHEHHFTVYLDLKQLDPAATYFLDFSAEGNELTDYQPSPLRADLQGRGLGDLLAADQTTQLDIVLSRRSLPPLLVFHPGNDPDLPIKWNRRGQPSRDG